jgi:signal peptidase I
MNNTNTVPSVLKNIGFTLLAEGKTIKVKADGYSMYPAVKPGSIIYVEPFDESTLLTPGDIIAWKRESGLVVHRLIRIASDKRATLYITRGDSCLNEDQPVTSYQIAGRVFRIENPGVKPVTMSINKLKVINYRINRLIVWLILKFRRIRRLLYDIYNPNLSKSIK